MKIKSAFILLDSGFLSNQSRKIKIFTVITLQKVISQKYKQTHRTTGLPMCYVKNNLYSLIM